MAAVGMSSMPPKVIGKEAYCYKLKVLMGCQRILDPKGQTFKGRKSKEVRDSMKVEKEHVHRTRYEGHCTK
jgi:hypothetical protein